MKRRRTPAFDAMDGPRRYAMTIEVGTVDAQRT
jgi:hypothetical protein